LLAAHICNEVLSNFDAHMGELSRFSMHGNRVVRVIAYGVGLVLAGMQAGFLTQQLQQRAPQPLVIAIHETDFPRTRLAQVHRREAVDANQQSASAGVTALIQHSAYCCMVGREDFSDSRRCGGGCQAFVGRDSDVLTLRGYGACGSGRPIAVDDQARIALQQQCRVQSGRQSLRDARGTDIPGDMARKLRVIEPE
jgi:hypothetical protein